MKTSIILIGLGLWLATLMLITTADAQTVMHQTIPGTMVRDYGAASIVINRDGTGYQTIPGTMVRDYSAPGITYQRGNNARIIRNQYHDRNGGSQFTTRGEFGRSFKLQP